MSTHPKRLKYQGHTYEWEMRSCPGEGPGPDVRCWMYHGKDLHERRDAGLIERLNNRIDRDDEVDESFGGHKLNKHPRRAKKTTKHPRNEVPTKTGQDSHGRLFLYDHEVGKGKKQKFYWKLSMFKSQVSGIVTVEVATAKGRATHTHNQKTMTAILRKVSQVFKRTYGEEAMLKVVSPK